ncbi:MAG: MFS transporter [Candidatus Acidiferrales bacterium]
MTQPGTAANSSRPPRTDRLLICAGGFVRSLGVGLTGVLLAVYLHSIGWDVARTGVLVTLGLAGAALNTLLVSLWADRIGRRRTLVALSALNLAGALALVWLEQPGALLAAAFFGMINGLGRDRGPAYALDQALLPETTTSEKRTWVIAWYSLILDAGLALGSLLAALPFLLRERWGWASPESYQAAWWIYAGLTATALATYAMLSPRVEVARGVARPAVPPPAVRNRVFKLAALTGMDSLGGGFLTGALVSYWFFQRFHIGEEWLGVLFFGARVANAASHLVAAWLAHRIGLVNTMVFTHIPSSLFLIAVPFAPTAAWAVALFLAREALVEMDVPTRQSYILAVVPPEARAFSSGITTLTRNVAYAAAPALAGAAMSGVSLSTPLFAGGGIKIAYDLLLYFSFRRIKPPEELRTQNDERRTQNRAVS